MLRRGEQQLLPGCVMDVVINLVGCQTYRRVACGVYNRFDLGVLHPCRVTHLPVLHVRSTIT